ncbi:hypothetical protein BLX87_23145 [Bacillus sp. VT-16-64]|nr:hypothetical protein BLX87_23145 [Bacillus sp. VT-16-64]
MANWGEVLYFVALEKGVDDDGFENSTPTPGDPRKVYANKKSVRSEEFHAAKQKGVTLSYMFEVRTLEYEGEEQLKYNGKDYTVYRTYDKGEIIEIICHRKSDDHAS